jgi:hypothetical protein
MWGLERLLSYIEEDPNVNDVTWAAYMLATVKTECADTWQPIKEYGCVEGRTPVCTPYKGKDGKMHDRSYGDPVPCPNLKLKPAQVCPAGKTAHHYYGRGYVQLTHQGNYKQMSDKLRGNDELIHFPERVMDPDTAYAIMSLGMRDGLFRHDATKKHLPYSLSRFLSAGKSDYKHYYDARNIINGIVPSTADKIAKDAMALEGILLHSRI